MSDSKFRDGNNNWANVFRLIDNNRDILIELYLDKGVAADQLRVHLEALEEVADKFKRATGIAVSMGCILRYILNQRKQGKWVRLGRGAKRVLAPIYSLSEGEITALKIVYRKIGEALDTYLYAPSLAKKLALGFRLLTGRKINGWMLVRIIMNKRKHGEWISLADPTEPFDIGVDLRLLDDLDNEMAG